MAVPASVAGAEEKVWRARLTEETNKVRDILGRMLEIGVHTNQCGGSRGQRVVETAQHGAAQSALGLAHNDVDGKALFLQCGHCLFAAVGRVVVDDDEPHASVALLAARTECCRRGA
jgi:hypothetical protein